MLYKANLDSNTNFEATAATFPTKYIHTSFKSTKKVIIARQHRHLNIYVHICRLSGKGHTTTVKKLSKVTGLLILREPQRKPPRNISNENMSKQIG